MNLLNFMNMSNKIQLGEVVHHLSLVGEPVGQRPLALGLAEINQWTCLLAKRLRDAACSLPGAYNRFCDWSWGVSPKHATVTERIMATVGRSLQYFSVADHIVSGSLILLALSDPHVSALKKLGIGVSSLLAPALLVQKLTNCQVHGYSSAAFGLLAASEYNWLLPLLQVLDFANSEPASVILHALGGLIGGVLSGKWFSTISSIIHLYVQCIAIRVKREAGIPMNKTPWAYFFSSGSPFAGDAGLAKSGLKLNAFIALSLALLSGILMWYHRRVVPTPVVVTVDQDAPEVPPLAPLTVARLPSEYYRERVVKFDGPEAVVIHATHELRANNRPIEPHKVTVVGRVPMWQGTKCDRDQVNFPPIDIEMYCRNSAAMVRLQLNRSPHNAVNARYAIDKLLTLFKIDEVEECRHAELCDIALPHVFEADEREVRTSNQAGSVQRFSRRAHSITKFWARRWHVPWVPAWLRGPLTDLSSTFLVYFAPLVETTFEPSQSF